MQKEFILLFAGSKVSRLENGVDTFVEIGPGKTLAGFMRKIAPKATVYNVSSFEDAIALEKCLSKA